MSKFFDYISWVLLAFVLGRALGGSARYRLIALPSDDIRYCARAR